MTLSGADQAAGLRQWVLCQNAGEEVPHGSEQGRVERILMVVGLPADSGRLARVSECLAQWAASGSRWVGDPGSWRVVSVDLTSPYLPALATQQSRWALWIDTGSDGFRHGYRVLRQLNEREGPRRLLALHPPGLSRRGLLNNLQQAAAAHFGIELVVLAAS